MGLSLSRAGANIGDGAQQRQPMAEPFRALIIDDDPDLLILVDVMMPEMDCYEVCRRLKGDPATAAVPVVLLTARRDLNGLKLADSGAAGVLLKPFEPAELARQVRALCQ